MKNIYRLLSIIIPVICLGQEQLQNSERSCNMEYKTGQLDNGLQYIIKTLPKDTGPIKIDLIVKAGALQQMDGQYEVAHLLEHMGVNGTKNFPDLRNDTELFSGLQMGPADWGGKVGGNNTQFHFSYPQEVSRALDTALAVYHDIATGNIIFYEANVHAERKALYQETLYSESANIYPTNKVYHLLSGCNDVPLPRNTKATVMNSSTEAMKQFYRDWYRPDLMVLSIIGNIKDTDGLVEKIRQRFNDLPASEHMATRKNCNENYLESPNQFIVQEIPKELKQPPASRLKFECYLRNTSSYSEKLSPEENDYLWSLFADLINIRLKKDRNEYNVSYNSYFDHNFQLPAERLIVRTNGEDREVFKRVFGVLQGISKNGFDHEELNFALKQKISNLQGGDCSTVSYWTEKVQNAIIKQQPLEDIIQNDPLAFYNNITLSQINSLVAKVNWMPEDIAVIVPARSEEQHLSRSRVMSWINSGLNHPRNIKSIEVPEQFLPKKFVGKLKESKIIQNSTGKLGEEVLQFENGLRVVLKNRAERSENKIMIHGFSPFGAGCFDSSQMDALVSPIIIRNSGVGAFNKFEVEEILKGTSLRFAVNEYIKQGETGVRATINPEDLELFLQWVYLNFTSPRFDKKAFDDWQMNEHQQFMLGSQENNSFLDFIMEQSGKLEIPKGSDRYRKILKVDHKTSFSDYQRLHSRSRDFTFILTGNFKRRDVLPMLQKYLGNLPNDHKGKLCQNTGIKANNNNPLNRENEHFEFDHPTDNKYLSLLYRTPLEDINFKEEVRMELLKQVLNIKLKRLRYVKKLGVYFYAASRTFEPIMHTKSIQIYLQSNPEDFEEVLNTCYSVVEELKQEPVSKEILATAKDAVYLPKWIEPLADRNKYITLQLYEYYRFNHSIAQRDEVRDFINDFTPEDVQRTAIDYFKNEWKVTGN